MAGKSKRAKYTSKGQRDSVSSDLVKVMRRDTHPLDRILHQLKAWSQNKKTRVTIPNPNKNETNKRFIKVDGTHSGAFGPYKKYTDMKQMNNNEAAR